MGEPDYLPTVAEVAAKRRVPSSAVECRRVPSSAVECRRKHSRGIHTECVKMIHGRMQPSTYRYETPFGAYGATGV